MKKIALGLLFAAVICAGCTTAYSIRLNDSMVITSRGKPKLDQEHNVWVYTDASGQTQAIPVGRVTQIAPQSMDKDKN